MTTPDPKILFNKNDLIIYLIIFSDDEEIILGDEVDPEAEMAAAEDAANERAQKQHEEALRNKLKANKRGKEKEATTSDDEEASCYEPPRHAKKQKTSVRSSGVGATKGTPEPKNSETFPSSMWPAGMSAQQVKRNCIDR